MGKTAKGVACAVILLLVQSGCSSSDEPSVESTTSTPITSSTTRPETEASLDESPVDGFTERSATFANLAYTVLDARLTNQDLQTVADGTDVVVSDEVHLVLDVRVQNDLGRQLTSDGDAISLEIGDQRIPLADPFLSEAVGEVRANTQVESFLAFEVDADVDLQSASILFGLPPDRPERLPLSGRTNPADLPRASDLTGTAAGVGPTNAGTIEFTLLGGTLFADLPHGDTTSPTGERADGDELFLQLHVRAEKTSGRGRDLLVDAFRLLIDDVPLAPFDVADKATGSAATASVEAGAAADAWVLFVIPADASSFVLEVGDFEEAPGSIPFALPSADGGAN